MALQAHLVELERKHKILEHELHEAVRQNVGTLQKSRFEIVRIEPVRGDDGAIAYYDVAIKP